MSKNETNEATPTEVKTDERFKMVTDPDTGNIVKRQDFILKCWVEKKMSRGAITKLLKEITGKDVKFQIVYAATKKIAGGPDKPVATEAAPAA